MLDVTTGKITREHLSRKAFLYIRQSTLRQVLENTESTKGQYAFKERLTGMGWGESQIEVIDSDLGQSGAAAEGRYGFQHLVSEVSLGRAGIIAGVEVSRLSRSSADWNRLMQIAALSDTLIMDQDGLYNVNDFNDRLLLGIKGTISEAELHYIRARMRGGLLNKAKRGELRRSIPIGYVYDDNGHIAKDPDAQVQEAITLFFNTFRRAGSATSLIHLYKKQGFLFPHREFRGFKLGELSWKKITLGAAVQTLKNPIYAGVYAYGRQQIQHTVDGHKKKTMPKEQYYAWLPNSLPAYINEAQFDENNLQLANNMRPNPYNEHGGAVREGLALLQGIVVCGKCGRKMTIKYSSHNSRPVYVCDFNFTQYGETLCQRVAGGNIDLAIESLLLETINPLTMDEAVSIQSEMIKRKEEIQRLYGQQLERARHEMELAKRRYLRVDPDNRLVAAELEYDWNQKVIEFESAKTVYEQKCETEIRAVDEKLKSALDQLVSNFPKIWKDPQTSSKEKKRIARLILEDVTITAESSKIILGIRFKGEATKIVEIPRTRRNLSLINMELAAVSEIRTLLPLGLTNQQIAEILIEKGFKTGYGGKPLNQLSVVNLIIKYQLPKRRDVALSGVEGWLTAKDKMAELGIDRHELRSMRLAGKLVYKECNLPGITYLYRQRLDADHTGKF